MSASDLEQKLLNLITDLDQFSQQKRFPSRLNIFEATGIHRQEIRHSNFLAFLLRPQESHGLGDAFLKRLLQKALDNTSLDLLKGFEAAARHLSFTHAAQELSFTQSAVSREIKTLEDQLGEPLFTRINRGLRLTDAGQVLYRAVGEALTLIDEATDRLAASRGGETLTVTTSVPLASMWLVPKLRSFIRLHPDVDVRIVAADQRLDLERERLDIAIRAAPPGLSVPGGEPLFDVEMFPVCSSAFTRRAPPLKSPADLRNHVLLDLETVTTRGRWSDWGPWLD
jgi:LysR family transcriptional regulator, glycine cleavage system transcriptional activator